jgi:hypothetical protein
MADTQIILKLSVEKHRIEAYIESLESKITDAKRDLIHVNATIRLFQIDGDPKQFPAHMGLFRLFKRGECFKLCQKALEAAPEGLDTRELAIHCIKAKGMDTGDKVLRNAVCKLLVKLLTLREKRGQIAGAGKRKGVRLWVQAKS